MAPSIVHDPIRWAVRSVEVSGRAGPATMRDLLAASSANIAARFGLSGSFTVDPIKRVEPLGCGAPFGSPALYTVVKHSRPYLVVIACGNVYTVALEEIERAGRDMGFRAIREPGSGPGLPNLKRERGIEYLRLER
jgi:hypothetical protein